MTWIGHSRRPDASRGDHAIATSILTIGVCAAIGILGAAVVRRLAPRLLGDEFPWWQVTAQASLTCGLLTLLLWRHGLAGTAMVAGSFTIATVPLALIDARKHRLPNSLITPTYLLVAGTAAVTSVVDQNYPALPRALVGAAALLLFYGVLYLTFPGQLGGGDVKLAGAVGIVAGWHSWQALLTSTLLGFALAAAFLVITKGMRGRAASSTIPFGPFMIIGTIGAVVLP